MPENILQEAQRLVFGERRDAYGGIAEGMASTVALWNAYLLSIGIPQQLNAKDVAMLMVLLKVSRFAAGADKRDHWTDIAGYAQIGAVLGGHDADPTLRHEDGGAK